MKEVTIGVYHQDCWGSGSSEKFEDSTATEKGPVIITKAPNGQNRVYCTMDVRFADNKQRDGYIKYANEHTLIKKANVLYKTDAKAIIAVAWEGSTSYGSIMDKDCVYTAPITQEKGGYETHTILTQKPNDLKNILNELEILGEVKIMKIKNNIETNNPYSLTNKQAQALRIARALGYYTWPRNVGLQELAESCGMTRRGFQENLRKAEAKVFPEFLNREMGL
ncbi:MAG: helix-turn-helix domain-containing protein [archaeon]|nr:helix-turn-helix domain-containing protein [archaeon]